MVNAPPPRWSWQFFPPFSLNPSFFPPLSSARQQFIYIIVYAGSLLPPRRTHYDFSCWCFPSSLFLAGFSPPRYETPSSSASPPRLRSANTPFLGFFRSISFSCIHIYVTDSVFPPLTSYRFSWRFFSPDSTDRIRALFRLPAVPGAAVVGRGVAPSLGYLLLFLTVCPHKQNGGLLFLLLWYGGRVWGTATLGVKGGRRERATTGRRGCLRKCSGVSGNRFWALFFSLFFPFFLRIFADFNLQRTVALHFYLSQIQRLSLQRKWRATYLTIILKSTVFKQGCVQNFLVAI